MQINFFQTFGSGRYHNMLLVELTQNPFLCLQKEIGKLEDSGRLLVLSVLPPFHSSISALCIFAWKKKEWQPTEETEPNGDGGKYETYLFQGRDFQKTRARKTREG